MADPDFIMLTTAEAQGIQTALGEALESLDMIGAVLDDTHPQHDTAQLVENAYDLLTQRLP